MSVLITGGSGFVGTNLARHLLEGGFEVVVFSRHPERNPRLGGTRCRIKKGSVTDIDSLCSAMDEDVEAVVHLVGILVETRGCTFEDIHVQGTRNVIEACKRRGISRLIHISALGTRRDARSRYHQTKWEAEEAIRASGIDYTIFRPSVIFGREDKFTNLFATAIRLSPFVMVPGNGKNRMQPVFVKDLVKAIHISIKKDDTRNKTYEVGGPDKYTFDEIIDCIARVLGRRRIKFHVPMPFMRVGAMVAEALLPVPPITRDQLLMLEEDNTTDESTLKEVFGIEPVSFEDGMRTYLS